MKAQAENLDDVLGPVRDVHVAEILESLARELSDGADVDAEPVSRDGEGRITRSPPLNLPRRRDLRVRRNGRLTMIHARSDRSVSFAPIRCALSDTVDARIAPFCWGAATVRVGAMSGAPDWKPVRLWFLEWFQARFGEESPDLLGVAHAVEGPFRDGDGWRFVVDLGSASVDCFLPMLEAFAAAGCTDIHVGETAAAL